MYRVGLPILQLTHELWRLVWQICFGTRQLTSLRFALMYQTFYPVLGWWKRCTNSCINVYTNCPVQTVGTWSLTVTLNAAKCLKVADQGQNFGLTSVTWRRPRQKGWGQGRGCGQHQWYETKGNTETKKIPRGQNIGLEAKPNLSEAKVNAWLRGQNRSNVWPQRRQILADIPRTRPSVQSRGQGQSCEAGAKFVFCLWARMASMP